MGSCRRHADIGSSSAVVQLPGRVSWNRHQAYLRPDVPRSGAPNDLSGDTAPAAESSKMLPLGSLPTSSSMVPSVSSPDLGEPSTEPSPIPAVPVEPTQEGLIRGQGTSGSDTTKDNSSDTAKKSLPLPRRYNNDRRPSSVSVVSVVQKLWFYCSFNCKSRSVSFILIALLTVLLYPCFIFSFGGGGVSYLYDSAISM